MHTGLAHRPASNRPDAIVNAMLEHQKDMFSRGQNTSLIYVDGSMTLDPSLFNNGPYTIYVSPQGHLNLPPAEKPSAPPTLALPAPPEPPPVPIVAPIVAPTSISAPIVAHTRVVTPVPVVNTYYCGDCNQPFHSRRRLKEHTDMLHPTCNLCHGRFANLELHFQQNHPECIWCKTGRYKTFAEFNRHYWKHHPFCEICQTHHRSKEEWLDLHAKCGICNTRFMTIDEKDMHFFLVHPTCTSCPALGPFPSQESFRVHQYNDHPTCTACSQVFSSRHLLGRHKTQRHPKCTLCPPSTTTHFDSPAALHEHTQKHHAGCVVCHVFYATQDLLEKHLHADHPVCGVCERMFTSRQLLRSHRIRRHPDQYGGGNGRRYER